MSDSLSGIFVLTNFALKWLNIEICIHLIRIVFGLCIISNSKCKHWHPVVMAELNETQWQSHFVWRKLCQCFVLWWLLKYRNLSFFTAFVEKLWSYGNVYGLQLTQVWRTSSFWWILWCINAVHRTGHIVPKIHLNV